MRLGKRAWRGHSLRRAVIASLVIGGIIALVFTPKVYAGGPRFVAGLGVAVSAGQPEGWGFSQLQYFTDKGDLNAAVSHPQADAMVAAAAAVWNVPSSSLSLVQGGQLAEDVSSANTTVSTSGVSFPADVEASNEAAVPLSVIYDQDGRVTDLLLGSGASDPDGCRQNAVTESVDDIQADGHIHHAILILNGRCVGSTPEQLTQMQYQVTRAFGRVLGVAWAQTNDNVFTALSTITADQENYWPVMHPLDVICGTYTYQCMTNPFTLRADDLSALAVLYPVTAPGGSGFLNVFGAISFPTGQGMDWVNVTAHRWHDGYTEPWELVSGFSGYAFQQALPNPVTQTQAVNQGGYFPEQEGFFWLPAVPVDGVTSVFITSEAINPLYTGEYAIGPYVRPPATPSGSPQTSIASFALGGPYAAYMTAWDAASSCSPGNDGAESAPASFDPSGWQKGLLCDWRHNSWWSTTVRAGHSWTLEVAATDETGAATGNKAQPVIGIWNTSDATGGLPTVASQAVPFNSSAMGVTQLRMTAPKKDAPFRLVIADQYGAGRPDFTYVARVLYADSVSPTSVGSGGGTITIAGTGFLSGNVVQVNGVQATIQSCTATQIIATVPTLTRAGARVGVPVTVSVTDPNTGGTTAIARALSYTQGADLLTEISAPTALETGSAAAVPFAVSVLASDGTTPVAGATVRFSVTSGSATLGLCGVATNCTGTTDSNGFVQTTVIGGAAGPVTLTASEVSGGATVQVIINDADPARTVSLFGPTAYVAAGAGGSWTLQLIVQQDSIPAAAVPVNWTFGPALQPIPSSATTSSSGSMSVVVRAADLPAGSVNVLTGCVWSTICATWAAYGVDAAQWELATAGGAGQSVAATSTLNPVRFTVTDQAGHPLLGAPVNVYQRVQAWEGSCGTSGACATAPVLAATTTIVTSDGSGLISVNPLQVPGIAQTIEIAVSTGTQGFATATLVKTPALP